MDASKLTQMRQEAANNYKSYWQGRDASEVTSRQQNLAANLNQSRQWGPSPQGCCINTADPNSGFQGNYSQDALTSKAAGCASCADQNWGQTGGIVLKTAAEISTILYETPNPVLGTKCCADPGIKMRVSTLLTVPSYTGWYNHIPTSNSGGFYPVSPLYPS